MLRFGRRLSEEHGQSLILLVLALTVMFIVGAIVVDVGLWLSERRGSQTDADFAALAGAYELLKPGASAPDAVSAASNALAANNQQGNASFADPVRVDNSCFNLSANDAVSVDVKHDSHALFSGIFGTVSPDIGAHAKACAGAANALGDIVPVEMSQQPGPCFDVNLKPKFTSMCPIECGAQATNCDVNGNNPRGILDLNAAPECSKNNGGGNIADLIEFGAPGTCKINTTGTCDPALNGPWYDCVAVQTGNEKQVIDGTNARVSKDGLCDKNFGNNDGVDGFFESVVIVFDSGDPYSSIYAPRDCDPTQAGVQMSPRLVSLIVLKTAPDPPYNGGLPIVAFAGFYIAGCADESVTVQSEADLDPDCHTNAVVQQLNPAANEGNLYVSAVAPAPAAATKTLTVIKHVSGGPNTAPDFHIAVAGGNPSPSSFLGSESGTAVSVDSGSTPIVSETGPSGYTQSLSSGCNVGIGNGQTCTITNTFITPTPTPKPTPTPTPTPTPKPTPTPTPGPPTPSPTPRPSGACTSVGTCVVYGRFVYLVFADAAIGPPTGQTTLFGITLKE